MFKVLSLLPSVLFLLNCVPALKVDKICDMGEPNKFLREAFIWRATTNQEFYCSLRIRDKASTPAPEAFSFAYQKTAYSFLQNQNQAVPLPTVVGTLQNVSISPSLPSGLNFNVTTGEISGTATAISPATNYSILATSNASQTVNITMKIRVFGTTATRVYGQADFISNQINRGAGAGNPANNTLHQPHSVLPSSDGVYIGDSDNRRILFFLGTSTTATRVYGNNGIDTAVTVGVSNQLLSSQTRQIALDKNNNLYVTDGGNKRVVRFPANTNTADKALGQIDLNTATAPGGPSSSVLNNANAIAVDSNLGIYVSDQSYHRLIYFPNIDSVANRVYGQKDLVSQGGNNADVALNDAKRLSAPLGMFLDKEDNVYIADADNQRVLFYPKNTTVATRVWGRGNFTDFATTGGGTCNNTQFAIPVTAVAVDDFGGIYIASYNQHRVLYFPKDSFTATVVFGQTNFTSCTPNQGSTPTASRLSNPHDIKLDSEGGVYIADTANQRVLYY